MSKYLIDAIAGMCIVPKFWPVQITSGALLVLLTGCISDSVNREPWDVVANCSSDVTSISAITGVTNPYYNGYRLISHTSSYERVGRINENRTLYSYMASPLSISITRVRQSTSSSPSSWSSRVRQTYDNNGYLTGGSRLSALGASIGFGHSYTFSYGDDGRLLGYDINQDREATFVYNQGRLDAINYFNAEGEISSTITYEYDEQSHLVSAFSSYIDVAYAYRCNALNQITEVYTNNIYSDGEERRASRYAIEYDEYGNLIKITERFPSGADGTTHTYEYEQTDELVFNHWLLRLSTGFVWQAANLVD